MTEPLKVERKLAAGNGVFASLSHQGILAICVKISRSIYIIQFTNLNDGRQVEIKSRTNFVVAFYDNMILLLAFWDFFREATVESVFDNPTIKTFKVMGESDGVFPWTDVSLLNVRRVLYYVINFELFSFNVDTRENTKIVSGMQIDRTASLSGINCGVKAVFSDIGNGCTYTLNMDNSITELDKILSYGITTLFPSTSNPKNIKHAAFKCRWDFTKDGNKINTGNLITFQENYSVIRIYRDIFLVFDEKTWSWVILRIVTP